MLFDILMRGLFLILAVALISIPVMLAQDSTIATRWVFFTMFAVAPFAGTCLALTFHH